jgi:hypothetical protein
MTRSQPHFRNPSLLTFASEAPRAVTEMVAFSALTPLMTRLPAGDGRPVMVLPGFTASDQSTAALRYVLARLDYSVHGWHLGQNLGPSQRIVDGMINRFDEIHHRHGDQPVTLIGARRLADRPLPRQGPRRRLTGCSGRQRGRPSMTGEAPPAPGTRSQMFWAPPQPRHQRR